MMNEIEPGITGGIYLVVNPAMDEDLMLNKLSASLAGGLQAVQLWDNWLPGADKQALVNRVGGLCKNHKVPLLINNDWVLLNDNPFLSGVHFDEIPDDMVKIREQVGRKFIAGITCSDDLEPVLYAECNHFDYVSFCAMFPSPSAGSCSMVMPETIIKARELTTMPFFLSGGITTDNARQLKGVVPFDGIAVISGIMSADDPEEVIKNYKDALGI